MRESFVLLPCRSPGRLQVIKPKTEELLYFLLWSCERLIRPTFRNLTESFEGWVYRNGFHRQLGELKRQKLLESRSCLSHPSPAERVLRLTEAARLHVLVGRDPEICWRRKWDARWHLVLFDLTVTQTPAPYRPRDFLRNCGFGYLQNSVWISPHPLREQKINLAGSPVDVESLILLEARPDGGESNEEIVAGAWDFAKINCSYTDYLKVLAARPKGSLRDQAAAQEFRKWAAQERAAWLAATVEDPLLPEVLLPREYLGRAAWQTRAKGLNQAGEQIRSFRS